MDYFVHPQAICETENVGADTRIWAFAHVLPGAVIGRDVNLCDHTFVENDVVIGDRVTIKCGVYLWDGIRLEDDVFVGPNANFTNDPFPRSKRRPDHYPETVIEQNASIGANATILPGLRVGRNAVVGAGAVVTRSVPANAMVVGNPARIRAYVESIRGPVASPREPDAVGAQARVGGVTLHRLSPHRDMRGSLVAGQLPEELPFAAKRYFLVYDVPSSEVRGEHALKTCHLFLVCVKGSVRVVVDDGKEREEIVLDRPTLGLHLPPMVWVTQYRHSPDTVLLVLASEPYDADDYIRDYEEFLERTQRS